jgi:hypothetical protein
LSTARFVRQTFASSLNTTASNSTSASSSECATDMRERCACCSYFTADESGGDNQQCVAHCAKYEHDTLCRSIECNQYPITQSIRCSTGDKPSAIHSQSIRRTTGQSSVIHT